uniref:Uncharacterized protein n=1 Tax=Arundo donax TaxID=35708 RepID=A0A0A9H9B2_ARUDO
MAPRAGEEEIRWLQASRQGSPDCGSGTPSPQLWAQQHHRLYPASAGSSPSRAQAIAGYRREMLDLVRGLPESAYELSLRDIVERPSPSHPPSPPPPASNTADAAAARDHEPVDAKKDAAVDEQAATKQSGGGMSKKQGRKQRTMRKQRSRSLERSVSLDTGLLIKLFMPLSIGGGKKKVSPKPDAGKDSKKKEKEKKKQGKKKDAKEQDEEWWTKSEFSEAASSSRTSSTGSSNSSTGSVRNGHGNGSTNPRAPVRSRSRKRTGCYAFFKTNKSKNAVNQD